MNTPQLTPVQREAIAYLTSKGFTIHSRPSHNTKGLRLYDVHHNRLVLFKGWTIHALVKLARTIELAR